MKVKVISLPYFFQVFYVLCFTRPRYQVSVYMTNGPNAAFGINLCKVYMNDDPKMTMTYIMANSNVVICVLE